MAFDGSEGSEVVLSDAASWTLTYRNIHRQDTKAHFFGKSIINTLLNQEGCMGIRIYYTLDRGVKELVLVGVDANEDDILVTIADASVPCPPYCGVNNELNS